MIAERIPADVLEPLDGTTVLDDELRLIATGAALRTLNFQELWDRTVGSKPAGFLGAPIAAQIEFTQRCNLRCSFCYNDSGPANADELEPAVLRRVCEELASLGIVELIISGGEPLVRRRHMGVILEVCAEHDIPVHLLTNGTLLTPDRLRWLKDHSVVTVQVSLDGADPVVHDAERGVRGSWARAVKGLSLAHEYGFHTLVSCTLTRRNADTVGDLVDLSYVLGADVVTVGDLITWGRAEEWMPSNACTNEQYDAAAETLRAKQAEYGGQMELRFAVNMLYYICQIRIRGQETILIRGNGDVIPHCTLSGVVTGNVNTARVADIWNRALKSVSEDPRLVGVLRDHQVVRTERLNQLRCFRRSM